MHMLLRNLLTLFRRGAGSLSIDQVGTLSLRVRLIDLDLLRHMNNGVYLSIMDLGRIDLLKRIGAAARLRTLGIYPVIVSQTITFRRSLELGQRYVLETRFLGSDEKATYLEQRFVVDGEIYARAVVRARFLRAKGGTVGPAELTEVTGVGLDDRPLPEWIARWASDVALPASRAPAPSIWE
jgi:acyl-CoA thioesterase FadM